MVRAALIITFLLSPLSAFAQNPQDLERRVRESLGHLAFTNIVLEARVAQLREEVDKLTAELQKERENAKQKSSPSPNDGSGGTQP